MVRMIAAFLLLSACDGAMPAIQSTSAVRTIYTFPLPLCLFGCQNSFSVIKEDVISGAGAVTTGGKTATQTTTGGALNK